MDIRLFFKGIGCFVTGLTRFYSDRTLLKYALFPFILMLVTHFIFLVSTVLMTAAVTAKLENWLSRLPVWISKTLSFVSILGSFMAGAAVILVSLLTFSTFFELFAGPFFDCLIKKYEKKYHGTDTDDVPLRRTLRFWLESACYAVNTLLILLILFLPAFR